MTTRLCPAGTVTTRPNRMPPQPRAARRRGYDLRAAWQLLADTCELPATERGLLAVLTEYRHALHALASQLQATQPGRRPEQPGIPPRRVTGGAG